MNSTIEQWIARYIDALGWLYQWPRAFMIPIAIAAFAVVVIAVPSILKRLRRGTTD